MSALTQPHRDLSSSSAFKRNKEPKFVPYEPYKAAVTSLVTNEKRIGHRKSLSVEKVDQPAASPKPVDTIIVDLNGDEGQAGREEVNDEKYKQVQELQQKLDESEKQLRIQLQVSSDYIFL